MFLHVHIHSFWKVSVKIPVLKTMPTPRRQPLPKRTDTKINSLVSTGTVHHNSNHWQSAYLCDMYIHMGVFKPG